MRRRCGGIAVTSVPATSTRPESGRSSPATIRNVVVLPQPDGPSSATRLPRSTDRSIPSTTAGPP
jgi:hypothetical protein